MTQTGKAVVVHGQDFEVREFAVPDVAPNSILLKQELAGICGTDLHNWQHGIGTPTLMGHENVGVVVALGDEVKTDVIGTPIKEGDRIVFHPRNDAVAYGFNGMETPFSGGFADYIHLNLPNTCLLKTETPPEVAVLAEPFTVGVHAVMRGDVKLGDTVIVQGSGAIGLLTMVCAKLSGAAKIIMVGGPSARLELAKKLGATVTVNIEDVPDVEERKQLVLSHTAKGKGADVVFECAGFLPAFPEGLEYVKEDGTFVEVGHFVDVGTVAVNPNRHFLVPNLRLEGIWGSRHHHFVRAMALIEHNDLGIGELISHQLPLDKVLDGFHALDGTYELDGETVFKVAVRAHD